MNQTQKNIVLPAEWYPQSFVQLTFPHAATDWAYMLDEVSECFCEIIENILRFENVLVVCADKESEQKIRNVKSKVNSDYYLHIVKCPLNDTWARDHSGITVFENGKKTVLDFTFNGWGLKFAANFDNQITKHIFTNNSQLLFPNSFIYRDCRQFIIEGGSIESDGEGTILTTEKCLLSENRNYLDKSEIEQKLREYFGAERILWLSNGSLAGDDTDSHIDTLARFCSPDTIAYLQCDDCNDEHFAELNLMEEELKAFRQKNGEPYNLLPLPMADAIFDENGERLPATYANFLIINGAVLVPTYNSSQDEIALAQIQFAFPDREIIGIDCRALIRQHGSLHCVTMQFPK
jgi:Peptidylarginine deiminase and related enzymes